VKRMIAVRGLGKKYQIGIRSNGYSTFRETVVRVVTRPFNFSHSTPGRTFWAIRDINFEVGQGEIVGVIGQNGTGKSTLLKILSRVTAPTCGQIEFFGRVGSLLELGTGFHPELTGRENVFLNGSILGMRRREISAKFPAIVDFADLSQFIDTPVKRYSSGMYVRLAFAVAAHLEPEILIIDEVLAVGDAEFQKKCLAKLREVSSQGRTVIVVSHNMQVVSRICGRALLLQKGQLVDDGNADEVISKYLQLGFGRCAAREWTDSASAPGNEIARLRSVRVKNEDGVISDCVDIRRPLAIEMEFDVVVSGHVLLPNFHFYSEEGACVFVAIDQDRSWQRKNRPAGHYCSTAWIPGNFLSEGAFTVGVAVSTADPVQVHFFEAEAVAFQVIDRMEGDSVRGDYGGPIPGAVRPMLHWTTKFSSTN
jgi:lipopolysaccharide transport system ATP-binding protein